MNRTDALILDLLKDDLEYEDARLADLEEINGVSADLPELIKHPPEWEGELGIRRLKTALAELRRAGVLPATAPHVHAAASDHELLAMAGRPVDLEAIASARQLSPEALAAQLTDVRARLTGSLASLLSEADTLVRSLSGDRYEPWKARSPAIPDARRASVSVISGSATKNALTLFPEQLVTAEDIAARSAARVAARPPDAVDRPAIVMSQAPTAGPSVGDSRYRLSVRERRRPRDWVTEIDCERPADMPPARWGFRLRFDPEADAQALEDLGFQNELLGALRLHYGEARWGALLDLLLPWRYGQKDDPVFDRAMTGAIPHRLPGYPRELHFWV
jgi:hypothetical protein